MPSTTPSPTDILSALIHLTTAMKVHRQFMSRVVPLGRYDAAIAHAEGLIRAAAVSGEYDRKALADSTDRTDLCVEALYRTIRSLPAEVLPS